ncbi:MAG: hypothetical protein WDO13_07750 [Verrucomicrobiota bacterium]
MTSSSPRRVSATPPSTFAFRSFVMFPTTLNVVITALAQKKSFDMLSEPTVLTKSGEQGVLEAVRVFPYPISFDPPSSSPDRQRGHHGHDHRAVHAAHRHRHPRRPTSSAATSACASSSSRRSPPTTRPSTCRSSPK